MFLLIFIKYSQIVSYTANRQEVQRQPYSCPADRKRLDRDRVNHFRLLFIFLRLFLICFWSYLFL